MPSVSELFTFFSGREWMWAFAAAVVAILIGVRNARMIAKWGLVQRRRDRLMKRHEQLLTGGR